MRKSIFLGIIIFWIGFLSAILNINRVNAQENTNEMNKRFAIQAITEIFFKRNIKAVDEYVDKNYIQHQPGLPQGRQAFKDYLEILFNAFPDYTGEIENVVAEGDMVSFHFRWRGTHQGIFMGVQPTGKMINRRSADMLRIKEGKLVEHWGVVDQLDMLKSLGLLLTKG